MGKFTKVSVPKIITDQIDKLLKNKNILYTTRASFIEDGIRRHVEYIEDRIIEENKIKARRGK